MIQPMQKARLPEDPRTAPSEVSVLASLDQTRIRPSNPSVLQKTSGTGTDIALNPGAIARALIHRVESELAPLFQRLTGLPLFVQEGEPGIPRIAGYNTVRCPSAQARLATRGELPHGCRECSLAEAVVPVRHVTSGLAVQGRCTLLFVEFIGLGLPGEPLATLCVPIRFRPGTSAPPLAHEIARSLLQLIRHDLDEWLWHRLHDGNPPGNQPQCQPAATSIETGLPSRAGTRELTEEQVASLPDLVRQMLDYVGWNFTHPVSLKTIAAVMGRNPSYLSDLFSHSMHRSFRCHLNGLRFAKARELLGDPTRSVREIAMLIGYTDPHEFRWAFKRWTGVSPTLWRTRHLAKQ